MIPELTIFDVSFVARWDLADVECQGLAPDDDHDDDVADGDDDGGNKKQDHRDRRDVQLPENKQKYRDQNNSNKHIYKTLYNTSNYTIRQQQQNYQDTSFGLKLTCVVKYKIFNTNQNTDK